MLQVVELYKKFGKLQVLKGIDASFSPGKVTAVIGHNGSGKTTMIKCILGMVIPDKGEVLLNDESVVGKWKYRSELGYMPQIGRYPDNMTMGQIFDMMQDLRKGHKTELDKELVEKYCLTEMFYKKMRTLSGGTRQKVSAALAFMFNPPVLILDEPTAGLDPLASEILKEKIMVERAKGKTIIITSHIMPEVDELADDIIFMHEGSIKFHKSMLELKAETGETKIGKALGKLLS